MDDKQLRGIVTQTDIFLAIINKLQIEEEQNIHALIIDNANINLEKSARNAPFIKVLRPEGLNVYDILKHDMLIITQPCLEKITRTLSV